MSGDESRKNGAEAIVDALIGHGVEHVFGIPGIQLDPLYDAFYTRSNRIKVLHTRHEQGSAFMAMGYAQASAKPGVFAVVPGPGLLNAMAAVSTARSANAPVLGLTGQIPSDKIGLGYGMAHELRDQLAMSAGVVDWTRRADHAHQVSNLLDEAFAVLNGPRPAPAIFEMAPDALAERVLVGATSEAMRTSLESILPVDDTAIEAACERIKSAKCPAIFAGSGAMDASAQMVQLAERIGAPVVMSATGGGVLPSAHPLAMGMIAGQALWEHVDLAIVVGTRFMAPALAWGREAEVEIIRIDTDPVQIRKPRIAGVEILASASDALNKLLYVIGDRSIERKAYLARASAIKSESEATMATLQPQADLAAAIRSALPDDAIVAVDVTQMASFVRYGGFALNRPRTLLTPGYQATLGYALPAALGAKVARPERKAIAICGDGGFMFTVQELATAVHHQIAVVAIVFDNSSFGNVKTIQAKSYGARHIAVELSNPDFAAMAKSYGLYAERAQNGAELEAALERCLAQEGPALIHVPIGEVPSIWSLVKRPPSQGKARSN